ncbi:MAG: EI24 domain-containing protein, partial [Planctomycetota bacterium]|nr:EI24 domain-containing protein [Planctomycetota bacterium]
MTAGAFFIPPRPSGRFAALICGVRLPLTAAQFLWQAPGVKYLAALPLLLTAIFYALVIGAGALLIHSWQWDEARQACENWWPWLGKIFSAVFPFFKWLLLVPMLLAVCYLTFALVGLVIASPINDVLSERVEQIVCGRVAQPDMEGAASLRLTALSIINSLWLVVQQFFFTFLALPLLLLPPVGAVALFVISAWFTGLGYVEPCFPRHRLSWRHCRVFIRACRWQILGLGIAMEALFFIPLLGLLALPLG